ncbi:MAG: VWA domain-containing protein [Lentisphaerae bacterium]|nr:VWA domain-containing protein [Lentisphaerota bacterium]
MAKGYQVLLSGLGFYKLSARRRKQLLYVFGGSLAVHLVGLLVFGGWIVMRTQPEEPAVFVTPPPVRTYEPRKIEHRVKVQKRQRSSSRPSMLPRMVSTKISDLSLPEIKVDPKIVKATFQPKFKAVSGKGLGAGLGTGYGTGGFGMGVSSVNFFGIRARGDKICILVDVSVSMVEEQRGGVEGYMRVKQRVGDVIEALSEMGMFNVIAFADAARTFESKIVLANNENKKKAKLFIAPYNTEGNWGLGTGNVSASRKGLPAGGGTTRLDLALTAAFLQGADTILVISDGIPRVEKVWGEQARREHAEKTAQWQEANAGRVAAWNTARAAAQVVTEKVWIPPRPARPPGKGPPREGKPVDRGRPARPGHFKTVNRVIGGPGGGRPSPPKMPKPGWWSFTDFVRHLEMLHKELYLDKGKKPPVIHCIGYQIDDQGHAFLQQLAKRYRGQYRRVRKLR